MEVPDYIKLNGVNSILSEMTDNEKRNMYNNPYFIKDLENGQKGLSKIIIELCKSKIVVTDKDTAYRWNHITKLWESKQIGYYYGLCSDLLEILIKSEMAKHFEDALKMIKLRKILTKIQNIEGCKGVFTFARDSLFDHTFEGKLNVSPNELAFKGGKIIDLKTLIVRDRKSSDYWSFEVDCTYLENNSLDNAKKFFNSLMCNENDIVEYLQKILGYCLTGETDLRSIFILYGIGSNGKSVTYDLLKLILQKLCISVDKRVFIKTDQQQSSHTAHLMPLLGARTAVYSETGEEDNLNPEIIKTLTGNDTISVRPLYGKQFDAKPFCKYLLLTNYKPKFDVRDKAIVDRVKYIPFNARFIDDPKLENEFIRDTQFTEDLKSKFLSEVFTYFCQGANNYYTNRKIIIPKKILNVTEKYINDLDSVSCFLTNRTEENKTQKIKKTVLYDKYVSYCNENGTKVIKKAEFYETLEQKGFSIKKYDGYEFYINITFRTD